MRCSGHVELRKHRTLTYFVVDVYKRRKKMTKSRKLGKFCTFWRLPENLPAEFTEADTSEIIHRILREMSRRNRVSRAGTP
jgi:hypothetical protein